MNVAGFNNINLFLLFFGGTICALIFIFSSIIKYQSPVRKRALLVLELVTSILLYADYLSYAFQEDTSTLGYVICHVTNFLLFFLLYVELIGLNEYMRTFVFETKKGGFIRSKLINIFSYIGIATIVINLFTGHIYNIDSGNIYHRGPLFFASFAAPLVIYAIIITVVVQYRKIFPKLIYASLLMFAILPLTGSVIQVLVYGISFMNLSIGLCAILLFALSLIDQNFLLMQIACREKASGLPNAYGFIMEMKKLAEKGKLTEYNAFHFDIKRMSVINRKFGGNVGSEIIVKYAHILRESLSEDEVLGRLGGNFFVALIKKDNTSVFLEQLAHTDVTVDLPNGNPAVVPISAVAGIYGIEDNNIESDQVMNNIFMAVNVAKNMAHKPYLFLNAELKKQIDEIRATQAIIPRCMANKEFKPFYQPKVDVSDYSLCGAEALARWEHEGKLIPPTAFIPAMEENETICELDFYMLEYVCNDIRKWLDAGITPPVISVNFSRKNLGNPILAEAIFNVLKKYNIPTNLIQIEITETVDEYPVEYLKGVVLALERYGITTAIDDFGTGSASINIIKEVPFNVLKIDKSFISSVEEKDRKILGHIIQMANDMGARVIMEGVETEEQLSVVKELGCSRIQGFIFDMPLPKAKFEARMANPDYR